MRFPTLTSAVLAASMSLFGCTTKPVTYQEFQRAQQTQQKYGLIVCGSSDYWAESLVDNAYAGLLTCGFSKENTYVLAQPSSSSVPRTNTPTVENLRETLENLSQKIKPKDIFVACFLPHGAFEPTDKKCPQKLILANGKMSTNELGMLLNKTQPRYGLCIADFCYGGALGQAIPDSYTFISSTNDNDPCYIDRANSLSWYFFLAPATIEADKNNNGRLTVGEMLAYALGKHSLTLEKIQQPVIKGKPNIHNISISD